MLRQGKRPVRHVATHHGIYADPAVIADGDAGMDACAHSNHAALTDPNVTGHCRVGQDDRKFVNRDTGAENIVRKEMDVRAEHDVSEDGKGAHIAALADLGVR